jgi:hypothetical protein
VHGPVQTWRRVDLKKVNTYIKIGRKIEKKVETLSYCMMWTIGNLGSIPSDVRILFV